MTSNSKAAKRAAGTKRVFHVFGPWNDRKEENWLRRMALQGWHLEKIGVLSYVFKKGAPADMIYRLDFQAGKFDLKEYLGIFRDAGWEHVGRNGAFRYFRTPAGAGREPEIHSDAPSRIAKYGRILLFFMIFFIVTFQGSTRVLASHQSGTFWTAIRVLQGVLAVFFLYALVRLFLRILSLKKAGR